MARSFEFLFDVGAPNAYLAYRVLPDFCARHGVTAMAVPVLLGGLFKATGNRAPMLRYADAPARLAYEQLEFTRFIAAHHLSEFVFNAHFPVNSLAAMRVLVAAQQRDCFDPALAALMRAMWEKGQDLAQPDIIEAVLDAAGLAGAALLADAQTPAIKAKLVANTDAAVARGAFGVPSFFVGDEMFFGKERLDQLAAMLTKA